jgi:dynein assembly factor 1, axonemal
MSKVVMTVPPTQQACRMTMEADAGRRAVLQWVRDRENARAGVENGSTVSLCPDMSPAVLKALATTHGGYETAELNDQLYLHFKGFRRIEHLEPYFNLKALWLDSNGIAKIENLGHLSKLRCLYLQNNLIEHIQGLDMLVTLVTLDLSHNRLSKLENLSHLPRLETLNVARNYLSTVESISHLKECPAMTNVDLSNNSLEDQSLIEEVLAVMPKLVSINIAGNAVVTETPHFRKRIINAIPGLKYQDRPIFEVDRVAAAAWKEGGAEGERVARREYAQKKYEQEKEQVRQSCLERCSNALLHSIWAAEGCRNPH